MAPPGPAPLVLRPAPAFAGSSSVPPARQGLLRLPRSSSSFPGFQSAQLFDMPDIFINNLEPPFPIRANRLLDSTGIRVNLHPPLNSPPPWIMKKIKVCSKLYHLSKQQNYTPDHYKQCALEHIQSKGPHKGNIHRWIQIFSRSVGCAAVSSSRISQNSLPTNATVFTAELTAIILAVEQIKFSDNNLNTSMSYIRTPKVPLKLLKLHTEKPSCKTDKTVHQ